MAQIFCPTFAIPGGRTRRRLLGNAKRYAGGVVAGSRSARSRADASPTSPSRSEPRRQTERSLHSEDRSILEADSWSLTTDLENAGATYDTI
ncbi:MAG: hypothetical protein PWQ57_631 [Desulfovibrionales bacterium]|jgi:hypothetical protein|nr:hypothetical protein [Desulfovibrionales bacterium]